MQPQWFTFNIDNKIYFLSYPSNESNFLGTNELTHYGLVTPSQILVNIGSGNGLLPDGTKPLPEPMLNYRKYGPVMSI